MPACLEDTTLPLLESAPAWTIRVARPADADRHELAKELRGVPKGALRQVFGKNHGHPPLAANRAIATPTPPRAQKPLQLRR